MTPEAQRIAIAEAFGWKITWHGENEEHCIVMSPSGVETKIYALDALPDYLNDLNAMHEAEKALPNGHAYWKFVDILDGIVKCGPHVDYVADRASATAAQRAKAFLHTIGKWVDE